MTLITDDYKKLNEDLHKANKHFGTSGKKYVSYVMELIRELRTEDILDYGCGKSTLADNIPFKIKQYDPCVPKFSATPDPAELVVCTDVLEHIEPDLIDNVLDDLKRVTLVAGFFSIANGEALKKLSDGRNAHLIQKPAKWWLPKILERFELVSFTLRQEPQSNEHKSMEEYILIVKPLTT
jgi:hypothetical protein